MKILITGSRNVKDKDLIFDMLNKHINKEEDVIIHGGAQGVDAIAELWCKQNKVKSIIVRPIRVDRKEDYLYRNIEMVGMCDKCFAFWDGKSRGTKFTYNYANKRKKVEVLYTFSRDKNET